MKINLKQILTSMMILGLLAFGTVLSLQAQSKIIPPAKVSKSSSVIFKDLAIPVRLSSTDFSESSLPIIVSGTGQLKLFGTLTTGSGCCVRVKITISRFPSNLQGFGSVLKEQTYEMCGSQTIDISHTLSADEDDARFPVKIENIDSWNKTSVRGDLTLRYPTADRILTGQPSIKFDLPQGIEANRQFTLSPNTPGKLKVKVIFGGNTRVRVTLKKPSGSNAGSPVEGASGTEFSYDIGVGDITGGNVWTVNVLNLTTTPADDVDVSVIYTVEQ